MSWGRSATQKTRALPTPTRMVRSAWRACAPIRSATFPCSSRTRPTYAPRTTCSRAAASTTPALWEILCRVFPFQSPQTPLLPSPSSIRCASGSSRPRTPSSVVYCCIRRGTRRSRARAGSARTSPAMCAPPPKKQPPQPLALTRRLWLARKFTTRSSSPCSAAARRKVRW